MEPLISIIVPIYKVEAYLERCLESLMGQSYRNLEIILVEDGSPDRCGEICDAYARKDQRIRVIHQQNKGLSGARNSGIDIARGDYLAFVDSDDYVASDYIASLYQLICESGCTIAQCRFDYVQGEPIKTEENSAWRIYRGESLMQQLYGEEEEATYFVVAWNKLYKRELFRNIRYPEGRIHEDEATTYKLFHEGKKLAFSDRALYGYFTENTGSITAKFSGKRLQWLTANEERIDFLKNNGYESILPAAYRKLCDACITFYFRCTPDVEDGKQLKKDLKKRLSQYRVQGRAQIQKLPMQTRIGYVLFSICPPVYKKLLERMKK